MYLGGYSHIAKVGRHNSPPPLLFSLGNHCCWVIISLRNLSTHNPLPSNSFVKAFSRTGLFFWYILEYFFLRKWKLRSVYECIQSKGYEEGKLNVIKRSKINLVPRAFQSPGDEVGQKYHFQVCRICWVICSSLNRKLVGKNAVTQVHGSCPLRAMSSWKDQT